MSRSLSQYRKRHAAACRCKVDLKEESQCFDFGFDLEKMLRSLDSCSFDPTMKKQSSLLLGSYIALQV